jgi:aminobenzoyl-glutamate utilization protein A
MDAALYDRLVALRRDLHQHAEPAWRELYTTARIVEELKRLDISYTVGPELLGDARLGVPDEPELTRWVERARAAGANAQLLQALAGGWTGVLATADCGEGPTVMLRVDIDALPIPEATAERHRPAADGFDSATEAMHACGHDAHATIGVGVLETIRDSTFTGTCNVLFQPAEEVVGGAKPVVESGAVDDVDQLLAVHVGLGHPTGTIVAGIEEFLAVSQFEATFHGTAAHAGGHPSQGADAIKALSTAIQQLHAIPRHGDGLTRINVGVVDGGSAPNVIPATARLEGEVRGETTALMEQLRDEATQRLEHAAAMHDCDLSVTRTGEAPQATNDSQLVDHAYDVAGEVEGVRNRLRTAPLGGSEDATALMARVQATGGEAAYLCVGTDHPGGHHTPTFDVDEASIAIGVDWLTAVIEGLGGPDAAATS